MKKYISVLAVFFIFQFGLFGQKEQNNKTGIYSAKKGIELISQDPVISKSHKGEQSLIRYLDKLSDEEFI
jgi:hypothetical protein